MVAKTAAVLAALGLIASGFAFAPAASAQTATATANASFSRDLTIGSTGADVTALQNFLIKEGYAIAAGATGYFGGQTQAALAKYQAANGITPAAGYFGPITRAKVSAGGSNGGTDNGNGSGSNNGGDLSGGEANLTGFDLRREESQGDEGEEEVEVVTVEFDVEDGDVRVERLELELQAASTTLETQPWDYIENISLWADGDMIADMDVDSRSDWDENDDDADHAASTADYYTVTFTGLDYVVEEDETAEITIAVNVAGSIDSDDLSQDFRFTIAEDGIRAVDAEGIQQYVGENTEYVEFGFGEEENGDLRIRSNSDDPDATILIADEEDESEEYSVFLFNIENREDVDTLITDLTVDVTVGSGDADDVIRRATLVVDGDEFDGDIGASAIEFEDMDLEIAGDDELEFELMITLVRDAAATTLTFDVDDADSAVEAEGVDSGDTADVDGRAESETHTIALTGVVIEPVSTSQSVVTPGSDSTATYGTFTIKFDVTALEDSAYISSTTDNAAAGDEGVVYTVLQDGTASTTFAGSAVLSSTAESESGFFLVEEGETETFTLTVTLDPSVAGTYEVNLSTVTFNDLASYATPTVFTIDTSDADYQTDPIYIAN